jgi:hypothetical protein
VLIFSPFTIHKAKHLGARAVERVGVDIDAIDGLGEGVETEARGQPAGEIVGAELQAKARGDEVKMETGVADGGYAVTEFVKVGGGQGERHGFLDAFAKIETVEGFLVAELGKGSDEIAEDAAEISAEGGDGGVVADIEGGELFGKGVAIGFGEGPLGEIVGEAFGEEMMGTEGLEGVVENRGITALLKAGEEFLQISGRLIADAGEISNGEKLKGSFRDVHDNFSCSRFMAEAAPAGLR